MKAGRARMRDCVVQCSFSAEREECWDSVTGLKQAKRTTTTSTNKRKRNLKRKTEECHFCELILCEYLMRASSCSFEFKSLMSWNLKSVTEQRAFHAWTDSGTLFSRFALNKKSQDFDILEGCTSTKLLQPKGMNSWQVSPGNFSLNSVAAFEGTHFLLFTSREDAVRFLFLVLLSFWNNWFISN